MISRSNRPNDGSVHAHDVIAFAAASVWRSPGDGAHESQLLAPRDPDHRTRERATESLRCSASLTSKFAAYQVERQSLGEWLSERERQVAWWPTRH